VVMNDHAVFLRKSGNVRCPIAPTFSEVGA
jgi:hypothetical protein